MRIPAVGSGSPAQGELFQLRAGPFVQGELHVLEFTGREALSKLFSFEVLFASDAPAWELEAGLVGQSATLVMQADPYSPRVVHGVGAWLRAESSGRDDPARRYTLRVVPSLWKLGKRTNTRIFQDQSASDVIATLVREVGLAVRFDLGAPLPKRAYCVQYQETDLAFIRRLLAELGCFFYFEPPSGILEHYGLGAVGAAAAEVATVAAATPIAGVTASVAGTIGIVETLVVSDQASYYPAIEGSDLGTAVEIGAEGAAALGVTSPALATLGAPAPTLVLRDRAGMRADGERSVSALNLRRALRANAVTLRDYTYERPMFDASGTASTASASGLAATATALGTAALNDVGSALQGGRPGSAASAALDVATGVTADVEPREVYRHQSDFFEVDAKNANAERELEQHRRRAWLADGESTCRRLTSGYKFVLAEHEDARMNRAWVATAVRHHGISIEWGSERAASDAKHPGLQYWNELTAAPAELAVRPRRPPPRAVQVADTAVVVGPEGREVYTDSQGRIKVQFHWDRVGKKDEHSSCWIRVMQSWAGTSWGAQFIPRVGMEVLVLYQQGDPDKPVVIGCNANVATPYPFPLPDDATRSGVRTHTSPGGGGHNELSFEDRRGAEQVFLRAQRNYDETVLRDHSIEVGGDEREIVRGDRNATVDGSEAHVVEGDLAATVGGHRTETVRGSRSGRVEGNAKDVVEGLEQRTVGGSAFLTARGNYQLMVAGTSGTVVGTEDKPGESHTAVWGKSACYASEEILIQSAKTIVLQCGESRVTLTPDQVTIEGKAIVVDGHESASIFGKKPVMRLTDAVTIASDKITLTAQGASLALDSDATLLGAQVKLGKGGSASTAARAAATADTKPFKLKLCDAAFKPYANKTYDLMVAGQKFRDQTDGDGNLHQDVPKEATVADLTLWLKPPPTGDHLRWQVRIDDALPPPSDVLGAQMRLRNLGYFMGEPDGQESDGLHDALRAFQRDQGLANDGELAGATVDKLAQAHGH
jgi:type VI secretion system secreted protein VgrG